jgi:phosphatidylglycerophosphate synthase
VIVSLQDLGRQVIEMIYSQIIIYVKALSLKYIFVEMILSLVRRLPTALRLSQTRKVGYGILKPFSTSSSSSSYPSSTSTGTTTSTSSINSSIPPHTSSSIISENERKNRRIMTIPNLLTLIRMVVLAPSAGYLIVSGEFSTAAYVVAAAGVLDALDGWVARTFDQKSTLGSYLDPAADKLLLVTCFITLGSQGVIPEWLVTLVVARDVGLVIGTTYVMTREKLWRSETGARSSNENESEQGGGKNDKKKDSGNYSGYRRIRPSVLSKVNTALQISLVCCGLSSAAWNVPSAPRQDVAFLLNWKWKQNTHDQEESSENKLEKKNEGEEGGQHEVVNNNVFSLLLPTLATSVALTTFASGLDYLFVAIRMLR